MFSSDAILLSWNELWVFLLLFKKFMEKLSLVKR